MKEITNIVNAVGVIFEDPQGRILLLLRRPNEDEGNTWGLVGGSIKRGEEPLKAACRETREEIGIEPEHSKLGMLRNYEWQKNDFKINFTTYIYKLSKKLEDIKLQTSENIDFMWILPADAYRRKDLMEGLYVILKDEYHL